MNQKNEKDNEKTKKLKLFLKILKKIRLSTLLLIALTLTFGSYSWFIYATKVDNSVSAHVKAWKVKFQAGEEEIEEYINFTISSIYPGMPTFSDQITAMNNGEADATLSYEVISAELLGNKYEVGNNFTSNQLETMIRTDFPFSISIELENGTMMANGGTGKFKLFVTWPYESGDDASDTLWGNNAYTYSQNHPSDPMIRVKIKISAVQTQ